MRQKKYEVPTDYISMKVSRTLLIKWRSFLCPPEDANLYFRDGVLHVQVAQMKANPRGEM